MNAIYAILFALYGVCIGSFLNVVIYRLPNNMSLSTPASHCPKCDYKLKWYDNIPLLSYLILGGKCRNCKSKISMQYFIVEGVTSLLFICAFYLNTNNILVGIFYSIIIACLICIVLIDFKYKIIYDRFHIIILLSTICLLFFDDSMVLKDHLIGACIGFLIFALFYFGSYLVFKKEAMGFGDVKLMTVCGLLIGYANVLLTILISSVMASFIILLFFRKREDVEHPFAPYLVLGVLISIFFGQQIIDWYVSLL